MSQDPAPIDYTPQVLTNSGVPVRVHGDDGTTVRHVRFTIGSLARLEAEFRGYEVEETVPEIKSGQTIDFEAKRLRSTGPQMTGKKIKQPRVYYGLEALQMASQNEPYTTILRVYAIAWNIDPDEVDKLLLPQEQPLYVAAINVALQLANGVDPTMAAEAMSAAAAAASEALVATEQWVATAARTTREAIAEHIEVPSPSATAGTSSRTPAT